MIFSVEEISRQCRVDVGLTIYCFLNNESAGLSCIDNCIGVFFDRLSSKNDNFFSKDDNDFFTYISIFSHFLKKGLKSEYTLELAEKIDSFSYNKENFNNSNNIIISNEK